jgi:probable phosphomutase (TIGR03848 family)
VLSGEGGRRGGCHRLAPFHEARAGAAGRDATCQLAEQVRRHGLNGTVSCVQRPRRPAERPTVICLVRHGTTPTTGKVLPGRARGLHLAESGRAEALAVAGHFDGVEVAAVYSSPLERARETAAPIADAVKRPVVVDRGLVECDFGDWTGAELARLRKLPEWKLVQRWPSGWRFPEGESFLELQERMQTTVERYRREHAGEVVVAVSHADCIKAVLAVMLGTPLDLFQRIDVGPCSTSAFALTNDGPVVLAVNSYGPVRGLPKATPASDAPKASRRPRSERQPA